ncbi:Serine/threonine-protein kinase TAO3 [Liparis tanakae]|uniref:non-specific serine/threonine protein kinase n=1 Tax=Liparis tanakae TaxID=230148 RepID=A0A4Z2EMP7_9TELE|nr:Serine/threonine-protein kinase TAO3 [Liparis tanakae]
MSSPCPETAAPVTWGGGGGGHDFVRRDRSPRILLELIQRTKDAVRELDNLQYRKMKKILYQEKHNGPMGESQEEEEDSEAASCKMNSLGSNHSVPSTSVSSQSSSVSSMQEVLDDSCSDMTATQPLDYGSLESCAHAKKDHQYWDDGIHRDHLQGLRPSSSDKSSQAQNYKNQSRFATIKSASLVRRSVCSPSDTAVCSSDAPCPCFMFQDQHVHSARRGKLLQKNVSVLTAWQRGLVVVVVVVVVVSIVMASE